MRGEESAVECDECGLGGVCVGAEGCACLAGWSATGETQLPGPRAAPCNTHAATFAVIFGASAAFALGSLVLLAAVVARKWRRGAPWASPAMGLQVALAGLFAACGLRRVLSGAKWLEDGFLMAACGIITCMVTTSLSLSIVWAALYVIRAAQVDDAYTQRLKLVRRLAVPLVALAQSVPGSLFCASVFVNSPSGRYNVQRLAVSFDACTNVVLAIFLRVVLGPVIRDIRAALKEDKRLSGLSGRATLPENGGQTAYVHADKRDDFNRRLKLALNRLAVTRNVFILGASWCTAQDVYVLSAGPSGFVISPYLAGLRVLSGCLAQFIVLCFSREFVIRGNSARRRSGGSRSSRIRAAGASHENASSK